MLSTGETVLNGTYPSYINAGTHTYNISGEYQIVITGSLTKFGISSMGEAYPIRILNLDMNTITTLNYGSEFWGNCSHVVGPIPNKLPPNLEDARGLFSGCYGLTDSIPDLPETLVDATYMFSNCGQLSGTIPPLPSKLEEGGWMFESCYNLSGNIPTLPTNLTEGYGMFMDCSGLTGSVPKLPSGLVSAGHMFARTGLTGTALARPSSLVSGEYNYIFTGTQITNNGSWISDAR